MRFLRNAFLIVLAAFLSAAAPHEQRRTDGPLVQLVQTVPVETHYGNPSLPMAHDVWLAMIRGATRSLDFEEFYLSTWPGEPMEDVLAAIGDAAKRGVRVRLLLDARMHGTYPRPADSLAAVSNIRVRLIDMGKIAGGVQHSKFFLLDDREVYLGSQNFDWRSLKHIQEFGVRIRDARVAQAFRPVFDMDWASSDSVAAPRDTSRALRTPPVTYSPPLALPFRIVNGLRDTVEVWPSWSPRRFIPDTTLWDRDAIVRLLDSARHEVVVQALTYAVGDEGRRDDTLDQALRRAARRGATVRVLISDWEADRPAVHDLESLAAEPNVTVRLSRVPDWSRGYIPFARVAHSKFVVVDSATTWVGTSNWDRSYFHNARNIAVTMKNSNIALQARSFFEAGWSDSASIPVRQGGVYAPRVHGETPPEGKSKYGG